MHRHHFSQNQPAGHQYLIGALQLNNLRDLALERHWRLGHAWHADDPRRYGAEPCQYKLIDLGVNRCTALIHGFGQRAGGQVPDKFAGLLDIVQAVFAAHAAKTNDRRDVVERIEKAVGRKVQASFGIL